MLTDQQMSETDAHKRQTIAQSMCQFKGAIDEENCGKIESFLSSLSKAHTTLRAAVDELGSNMDANFATSANEHLEEFNQIMNELEAEASDAILKLKGMAL
jgi:translation initiation factor 2 alpha subunit (eIF-2alpha)